MAWVFYLEQLPRQLGWPTVILAAVYLTGAALRPGWRLPRGRFVFLLSWFGIGYLFFSYIMVREPRHDLIDPPAPSDIRGPSREADSR